MTSSLDQWRANARAAEETGRQVRRLYNIAYRVAPIGHLLASPDATTNDVAYATARIPRAVSAAARILALPGVADHAETPYARSFINAAERTLKGTSTRLLITANGARAAAAQAAHERDDLRSVLFTDIEQRCRNLVARPRDRRDRADREASDSVLALAAQWGLHHGGPGASNRAISGEPAVPHYVAHEVARRAEIRARCTAGIRCTRNACLEYGAVWAEDSTGAHVFLCLSCIPVENADRVARGFAPTIRPVPDGVPASARYVVFLYNGSGRGGEEVSCDTAQEAQFVAETMRPFNNTGHHIRVALAR
ncbi:hypothetical protein OG730_41640 (plasmid) [Streptomyces sp. NBC_01298]|uniref:hypothetical protein n=1 Tax=Streptomyces sp. NBC_01298 TaxID=2903817 RepID=UPI002E11A3A1|nr:hypothetical protein OG730_41640 [Streptomyces sp. NBC_01298]